MGDARRRRRGSRGLDLAALGIPSLDEIVARYSDRSGVPVADRLDWYFAYNLFRLAGIVQGIKKRVIDGTASHAEARTKWRSACRCSPRRRGASRKGWRLG